MEDYTTDDLLELIRWADGEIVNTVRQMRAKALAENNMEAKDAQIVWDVAAAAVTVRDHLLHMRSNMIDAQDNEDYDARKRREWVETVAEGIGQAITKGQLRAVE